MRILKLSILELKRSNTINLDEYTSFYITSPATFMSKKVFCVSNGIDYKKYKSFIRSPWKKIIKMVNSRISDEEAKAEGKRLTLPFKQRYDQWMKEYKKWNREFVLRRGRHLIQRV